MLKHLALLALLVTLAVAADTTQPELSSDSDDAQDDVLPEHPEDPNELIDILPSEVMSEKDMLVGENLPDDSDDIEDEEGLTTNLLEEDQTRRKRWRVAYAVGDPHFRSFDGQYFHFQGVGQYLLSRCGPMEIQARNFRCGRHRYYGVVACYREAAIKTSTAQGEAIVQVTTRGKQVIKVNGEQIADQNDPFVLASGCSVQPQNRKVTYFHKKLRRMISYTVRYVSVTCGDQTVGITTYGIYHRIPACQKCTPGTLFGDNDCNAGDDFRDFRTRRIYRSIRSTADKLDNNPKKAIHKWGESTRVGKKNGIANIFDDAAKKYQKPDLVPGKMKFRSLKFKKNAHAFCKQQALTLSFYFDCMQDCAATGTMNFAKRDTAAAEIYAQMKKKHKNYHKGKGALIKVLNKMLVDFGSQCMMCNDEIAAHKVRVHKFKLKYTGRRAQAAATCNHIRNVRAALAAVEKNFNRANGARSMSIRNWNKWQPKWLKQLLRIKREDALIRRMLRILKRLRRIKSVADLQESPADAKDLEQSPEIKAMLTELIERKHSKHTNPVKKLLLQLLWKLSTEAKMIKTNMKKARASRAKKDKIHRHWLNQRRIGRRALQGQKRKCRQQKARRGRALAAYRAVLRDAATNNRKNAKMLRELREEMAMCRNLKATVMDWSRKKRGYKKCKRDEDTSLIDEAHALSEDEMNKADDEIPVMTEEERKKADAELENEAAKPTANIEESEVDAADEAEIKALEDEDEDDE